MATARETRTISDSRRDAKRYNRLLAALDRATVEIRAMQMEGSIGIDTVLDRLLPVLAGTLNAKDAFAALLKEGEDGSRYLEITAAYPREDLRGHCLEYTDRFQELITDGKRIIIDPLWKKEQDTIPGLGVFDATAAIVVRMESVDEKRVVGVCNKRNPESDVFLAADGMSLDIIVELVDIGARVGEQRRRELEAIQETSRAISSSLDLEEVLATIADSIIQVTGCQKSAIFVVDKMRNELNLEMAQGLSKEYVLGSRALKIGPNTRAAVIFHGAPIAVMDIEADPRFAAYRRLARQEGFRALIDVPMMLKEEIIGTISAYYAQPHDFSKEEIDLLATFANQAAIAIQNALLRRRELEGLLVTSDAIKAALDPSVLLELVTTKLSEVFDASATSLMLWDGAEENLVIMAGHGLSDEYVLQQRIPKETVYAAAVPNGEFRPLVTHDLRLEPFGRPGLYEKERLCTALSMPLLVSERLIGVLNVYSRDEPREFTPHEIELAAIFANQVAVAIETIKLHQEARQRGNQLVALDQIALDITRRLETKELLRAIMERATDLVQGTGGGVYLFIETDEAFRSEAVYGLPSELEGVQIDKDKGVIGQVLRTKQPVAVADYQHWSGRLRILDEHELTAVVGAPIMSGDRFLGVIAVHDTSEGRAFGEAEKELLHRFGNHAAVAIEKARLFAETSRRLEELNRLYEGSQIVVSPLSLDAVLARIVELAGKVAGSDHTGVVLVGEDGRLVTSIEDHEVSPPLYIRARPGGITRKVMATGRPELFDNVVDDGRHNPIIIEQGFKSYAGVPIVSGGKVLGVLFVHSFHPHAFTQRVPLLTLFASQAAIAIQNAQLHTETERRLKQLELLEEVKQAVDSVFDLQQVLNLILRKGLEMVHAEAGSIMLVDNKTHLLKIQAWFGSGWTEEKKRLTFEVGTGTAGWVAKHKVACRWADVQKDSRFVKPTFDPSIRSLLAVPILSHGRAIGVLNADSSEVDFFGTEDERLLNTLAGQVAIAIEKAKLLGAVQEIGLAIVQAQALDRVLQLVMEKSLELIGFDNGWLSLINEQGKLEVRAATKPIDDSVKIDLEVDERSIPGWVAKTGQPLNVLDVSRDPRYRKFYADTRSELAVPLKTQRRVVGVLNVESTELNAFDQYDMRMLAVLANQAAVAVENAKQYEALREARDELLASGAIAWMGLFGSEWSHTVAQKTYSIRNYVDILKDVAADDNPLIERALDSIDVIAQEIQDVPLAIPSPADTEKGESILIDSFVSGLLERWCEPHEHIRLELDLCCGGVLVRAEETLLKMALQKLVDNAIRSMPDSGTLRVESRIESKGFVTIALQDTGFSIPDEHKSLFGRRRIPKREGDSGSGMGALLSRFILRRYGGDLKLVWSEKGKGTRLEITLPVCE